MWEVVNMIKKIAWDTFKKTGDINVYLEFSKLRNMEESLNISSNETDKSKWNNNSRK